MLANSALIPQYATCPKFQQISILGLATGEELAPGKQSGRLSAKAALAASSKKVGRSPWDGNTILFMLTVINRLSIKATGWRATAQLRSEYGRWGVILKVRITNIQGFLFYLKKKSPLNS